VAPGLTTRPAFSDLAIWWMFSPIGSSSWFERMSAATPSLSGVASTDSAAGVDINGVGWRWHAGIKAMGEGKALRIVEWLREHQDSIALQLGAMLLEQSDEWSLSRRHMQLEGLQSLSDTASTRVPAFQR
jgi:hypothetical protein